MRHANYPVTLATNFVKANFFFGVVEGVNPPLQLYWEALFLATTRWCSKSWAVTDGASWVEDKAVVESRCSVQTAFSANELGTVGRMQERLDGRIVQVTAPTIWNMY